MALSLVKLPRLIRPGLGSAPATRPQGSGRPEDSSHTGAFDPIAARAAWLETVRALARAAAQADHDAATRHQGRAM